MLENVSSELLSLELECPHIVRAFLVLVRTLHGHTRPFPHLDIGLTVQYILDFANNKDKSVALMNIVHSLATTGWALFLGIQEVTNTFSNLHSDTVALLGYDPKKQVGIVERINAFIGRITHRNISDMVIMQHCSKLEDMWYAVDVLKQRRAKCEEVRNLSCVIYSIYQFSFIHSSIIIITLCSGDSDLIFLSFRDLRLFR